MSALDVLEGRRQWFVECCDVLDGLRAMPSESVNCVVTSPPYWGLRDYGIAGQIGLEPNPRDYAVAIAGVFSEVRRVLADDGTLWLNLGDSYAGSWGAQSRPGYSDESSTLQGGSTLSARQIAAHPKTTQTGSLKRTPGLKAKDLIGVPWRVAFALQGHGWYLRSDIIWAKPNPMPESVTDRPTRSHEYVFLLTKSARYFYDAAAIAEPLAESSVARLSQPTLSEQQGSDRANGGAKTNGPMKAVGRLDKQRGHGRRHVGFNERWDALGRAGQAEISGGKRNKRDVWTVATEPFSEAHFAIYPPALVQPCILAGCPEGGVVLDPFSGAGTTVMVALRHGRRGIGLELNPAYVEMSRRRIVNDAPMFNGIVA